MTSVPLLLWFGFYEPIYYHINDASFSSDSKDFSGHWVGISENVGNFMTFKILTDDTKKVIYYKLSGPLLTEGYAILILHHQIMGRISPKALMCQVRAMLMGRALKSRQSNQAHAPNHGESPRDANSAPHMPVIDPEDLVRCTFLLDEQDDGQHFCTCIVECITEHDKQARMDPDNHV